MDLDPVILLKMRFSRSHESLHLTMKQKRKKTNKDASTVFKVLSILRYSSEYTNLCTECRAKKPLIRP